MAAIGFVLVNIIEPKVDTGGDGVELWTILNNDTNKLRSNIVMGLSLN